MKSFVLSAAFLAGCIVLVALQAAPTFAQAVPTGTVSGHVSDSFGFPAPDATISVESPALQGTRKTTSTSNGDYVLPFLPAGEYAVAFTLEGFRTVRIRQLVAAAQSYVLNVTLEPAAVKEVVQVAGGAETLSSSAPASATIKADVVNALPTARDLTSAILIAPSVKDTGPGNNITVAGSLSYESLYLVNGVVVNENLRGQALPLFIEDALQETAVSTSGIPAEYGRFAGGVVNAVTKSGSNRFSGSFRASFANDRWRSLTPYPNDTRIDRTVPTYEMTLGGPVVTDRLWYFGAARFLNTSDAGSGVTTATNIPYRYGSHERRAEAKLTYSPNASHTIRSSYTKIWKTDVNHTTFQVMDLASLSNRDTRQDLTALHYAGIVTPAFFIEAQLSERRLTGRGAGSPYTDRARGTLLVDQSRNARFWSPTFCGVCSDERRDNLDVIVKGHYFLSTAGMGSHRMVFGLDNYHDRRLVNNHQSGSDYRILATRTVIGADNTVYPVFDANTQFLWQPIPVESNGNDFQTYSLFYNDAWQHSRGLTVNLGVRWDKHLGTDQTGARVIDSSAFSPRLAVTFNPSDAGPWTLAGSYARYVTSIANTVGDAGSSAGNAAHYWWHYGGPAVNTAAPYVTSDVAIQQFFGWYDSVGGNHNTLPLVSASVPGINTRVLTTLASPSADELAGGVGRQLGSRGAFRADVSYRRFRDFYGDRVDRSTGQVSNSLGRPFDLHLIENTNDVERRYWSVSVQGTYHWPRAVIGGAYTLSRTWGSFNGETVSGGPSTATPHYYPEYTAAAWNRPVGDLLLDQRHRARVYTIWSIPLKASLGRLEASVLEQYGSGTPYFAAGTVKSSDYVDPAINARYVTPGGGNVIYYFTAPDAYRTEADVRTDLALNYSRRAGWREGEVFAQFQLLNAFNQSGLSNYWQINTTILTNANSSSMVKFDPFTTTPVRGLNWTPGPLFGQASGKAAYATPRTFRFSVGFRF